MSAAQDAVVRARLFTGAIALGSFGKACQFWRGQSRDQRAAMLGPVTALARDQLHGMIGDELPPPPWPGATMGAVIDAVSGASYGSNDLAVVTGLAWLAIAAAAQAGTDPESFGTDLLAGAWTSAIGAP